MRLNKWWNDFELLSKLSLKVFFKGIVQPQMKKSSMIYYSLLHKRIGDGLDWCGVHYLRIIVMFLSAVWTLILTAPIHCSASIAEQVM